MNEIYLYELFRSILSASKVIAGRFVVAEGYGNDLNTNSFDNHIIDALGGISSPQKYPAAVLMPPVELVDDRDSNWSRFELKMFFLTTTYNSGLASIKGIAGDTNTSKHQILDDWKDMRECAGSFRRIFNELVREHNLSGVVRESQKATDVYERYSMMNNDRLSGVCLSFEVALFTGCNEEEDYPADAVQTIALPAANFNQ
jgi:hypothetical protein